MNVNSWLMAGIAMAALAGCDVAASNNGDTNNGATNNGATNNGATNNGATNNGATNNGATNNGATNNGATNNGATNNGATNNGIGEGWQKIELLDGPDDGEFREGSDDVHGIYCESPTRCVFGTYSSNNEGVIYAGTMSAINGFVFDGEAMSEALGATWTQQVAGIDVTAKGVTARMNHALFMVYADGDFMDAANWKYEQIGTDFAAGNAQLYFASSGDTWRYLYNGVLWGADEAPSANTVWTGLWSPNRIPPFPANYMDLVTADSTICDTSPSIYFLPKVGDVMYASDDLSLMLYTAGAVNAEAENDTAGVCVSTDMGMTFRHVAFPGAEAEYGPKALHCEDADHCWAINGLSFDDDSHYVYFTTNASAGVDMTWQRSTLPGNLTNGSTSLNDVDFANNMVGYVVGHNDNEALVLKTTDGGATFVDISSPVAGLADGTKLLTVFALDEDNVLVGGENGALLTNGRGGAP